MRNKCGKQKNKLTRQAAGTVNKQWVVDRLVYKTPIQVQLRQDWNERLDDEERNGRLRIVEAWTVVFDEYLLKQAKIVALSVSTDDLKRASIDVM